MKSVAVCMTSIVLEQPPTWSIRPFVGVHAFSVVLGTLKHELHEGPGTAKLQPYRPTAPQ